METNFDRQRVDPEQRFTWVSGLVLALAVLLVAVNVAELAYRLTVPTDGWYVGTSPSDEIELDRNLLGAATPLRRGDVLLAIGGRPPAPDDEHVYNVTNELPAGWAAGASVPYTVRREGQTLALDVPLHHWQVGAVLWGALDPFLLAVVAQLGVAGLAFARRPGSWGARTVLFLSAALLATFLSSVLTQTFDGLLPSRLLIIAFSFLSWGVLIWPSFFLLALSFPRPKRFFARRPLWVVVAVYATTPLLMALTGELGIGWLLVIVWALLSVLAVAHSALTVHDPVGRAQIRWAAVGLAVGALGIIANNVISLGIDGGWIRVEDTGPSWMEDLPFAVGILAPALGLSIAILRYRLFDIDVIIRRTLLYAALTGLLAAVYFGTVVVAENVLRPLTGQGQNQLATVISTLAMAALFVPLRRRVQGFIDRRFYRGKYDGARTLAAFAAQARDETDLDALTRRLEQVVAQTLQPTDVTLWLRGTPGAGVGTEGRGG